MGQSGVADIATDGQGATAGGPWVTKGHPGSPRVSKRVCLEMLEGPHHRQSESRCRDQVLRIKLAMEAGRGESGGPWDWDSWTLSLEDAFVQ